MNFLFVWGAWPISLLDDVFTCFPCPGLYFIIFPISDFSFSFLARCFPSVCDFHVLLVQSFHSPWYSGFFLVFQGLIC